MTEGVLILSGVSGDTRRYRTFHLFEQLQLAGVSSLLTHVMDPALLRKVRGASMIVLHRTAFDPLVDKLMRHAREQGALLIADVDDLIFDIAAFQWIDSPDFQDPVRASLYKEDMSRHRQTLLACEAALTSTDFLAEQVRKLGRPAWTHRNSFSQEMLAFSEAAFRGMQKRSHRTILGYASGTPTHDRDFQVVRPVLRETLSRFESTELWLIGPLNPGTGWGPVVDRVRRIPFVPWRQLPALLASFDVNLAPLVMDNPFSHSKSEIKYMEAALVRVPTVASPTAAFRNAIEPGSNGLLAATQAEWQETLTTLVQNPDMRRDLGQRAYESVLERYHPSQRSRELAAILKEMLTVLREVQEPELPIETRRNHAPKPDQMALQAATGVEAERTPSLFQMGFYNLRYRGLGTLLRRIWVFFRRLVTPVFPFRTANPVWPQTERGDEVEELNRNSAP